jgi:hypothetical protein
VAAMLSQKYHFAYKQTCMIIGHFRVAMLEALK